MLFTTIIISLIISCIHAAVISRPHDAHDHAHENEVYDKPLPAAWYQSPDHPVHSLFKRGPTDGTPYEAVGSAGDPYLVPRIPL